jgi:hypothetical protein
MRDSQGNIVSTRHIRARLVPDEGRPMLRKWQLGQMRIGTWGGPPPRGAVDIRIGRLDLYTGIYRVHGPRARLP